MKENDINIYSDITKGSIKVSFWTNTIRYCGLERVITILLNYLAKEKYFTFYLITSLDILEGEYSVLKNIKRISLLHPKKDIIQVVEKEKLDTLIYNFYSRRDISKLNNESKNTKIIYYDHLSFAHWILFG